MIHGLKIKKKEYSDELKRLSSITQADLTAKENKLLKLLPTKIERMSRQIKLARR